MSNFCTIYHGDNLAVLDFIKNLSDTNVVDLIYMDPPFNTGYDQVKNTTKMHKSENPDRVGFGGESYETRTVKTISYKDSFSDYQAFMKPRLQASWDILKPNGSMFVHLDYREVHYIKVLMDQLFGRDKFMNEIIWAYDYGGKPKTRWACKHDTILWYVKNPKNYTFNHDQIDRIPYLAPDLVTPEKAARGKVPTDSWFMTIVPTNSKEKTGYPTQKPEHLLRRIIKVHSNPGDLVLDPFAGSGTTASVSLQNGRNAVMIDSFQESISVMQTRLLKYNPTLITFPSAEEQPESVLTGEELELLDD